MSPKLVIDTNFFINHRSELMGLALANDLITTPSVLAEIKDAATKDAVSLHLPNLRIVAPTKSASSFVIKFAKNTGDFISLSQTDVDVIAVAYDVIQELGKLDLLRKTPLGHKDMANVAAEEAVTQDNETVEEVAEQENNFEEEKEDDHVIEEEKDEEAQEEEEVWTKVESRKDRKQERTKKIGKPNAKKHQESLGWGGEWNSDDEKGWVGPSNLEEMKVETFNADNDEHQNKFDELETAVLTGDFAMQNIILQIGIPLLNPDGKVIRRVKSYVLECFSCWTISRRPDIVFCKKCGKSTLLKVTCEFSDNGEFRLFRKRNKQIRIRGARFPIPKPKEGRQVDSLLLYEDDLLKPKVQSYLRKVENTAKREEKKLTEGFELGLGLDSSKSQKGKIRSLNVSYGSRNPNANSFWKNKKK